MKYYNTLISKTYLIFRSRKKYLVRGDNRKLVISRFPTTNYSYERSLPNQTLINGCWWNKIDLKLFSQIKKK